MSAACSDEVATAWAPLIALPRAREDGKGGYFVSCPTDRHQHGDRSAGLHVTMAENGNVLVTCFAGCSTKDVMASLGLRMSDLFADTRPKGSPPSSTPPYAAIVLGGKEVEMPVIERMEVLGTYSGLGPEQRKCLKRERCLSDEVTDRYQLGITEKFGDPRVTIPIRDANGDLVDIRCWLHPRRRANGAPKIMHWEQGYGGARLYPIDMLDHKKLVLVAGELDALALISNDIPAITVTAGESTWPDALSEQMAAAGVQEITILPDFDETGLRAAEKRARSLFEAGMRVRVASWN